MNRGMLENLGFKHSRALETLMWSHLHFGKVTLICAGRLITAGREPLEADGVSQVRKMAAQTRLVWSERRKERVTSSNLGLGGTVRALEAIHR